MPKFIDLTGRRIGKLVVLRRGADATPGVPRWICVCDCGKQTLSYGNSLRSGKQTSCGCEGDKISGERIGSLNRTHGQSGSPTYRVWLAMRRRCYFPIYENFKHYGGRGIAVCDRWRDDFPAFLSDMGERPSRKHTLERVNNDGNYEPGNCRWATVKEQCNNRRNNVLLTARGETKTVAQWADETGLQYATIYMRIRRGLPPEQVLLPVLNGHGAP